VSESVLRAGLPPALVDTGVAAVLRAGSAEHLHATVTALVAGGVRCLELTTTTPDHLAVLSALVESLDDDVSVGLGTITDLDTATRAIDAGAAFLVTPGIVDGLTELAHQYAVPTVIGIWSPTEVIRASAAGADLLKVFPAGSGGVPHLRSLLEPFAGLDFMPSGGVTLESAPAFVAAGARAVSLGGALTGEALRTGEVDGLRERAAGLLAAVADARTAR